MPEGSFLSSQGVVGHSSLIYFLFIYGVEIRDYSLSNLLAPKQDLSFRPVSGLGQR